MFTARVKCSGVAGPVAGELSVQRLANRGRVIPLDSLFVWRGESAGWITLFCSPWIDSSAEGVSLVTVLNEAAIRSSRA